MEKEDQHILRREKSFCKFFREFFRSFCEVFKVFASCLRFSGAFRGFRIHSDPLGCIRMHSEAIGSVWTFRKILRFFGFLSRFSTFPDVIFTKDFFHGTIGEGRSNRGRGRYLFQLHCPPYREAVLACASSVSTELISVKLCTLIDLRNRR